MDYIRVAELNQIPKLNRKIYFLAGATDLYVQMKEEMLAEPSAFVDISSIARLRGVVETKNSLIVGPLTTFTEAAGNKLIKKYATVLVPAAEAVAAPQIRNRGTLGGNIGNSSPAGDSIPALYVLEAKLKLYHYGKTRTVEIEKFFTGPKRNILKNGEIITEIIVPKNNFNFASYKKLAGRQALAISKVSLAVAAEVRSINGKKINDIRIAAGAVGPTVLRCRKTENFLKNKVINKDSINEAVNIIKTEAFPIDDIRSTSDYRKQMVGILLKQSLQELL